MNKEIRLTVLMPVFNAEQYLSEAIESILNQTYTDFRFLIINDGSNDGSHDIITSFNDDRIDYVLFEKNSGIVTSLNYGLSKINTEFIARMDADDFSLPNRFEKQIKFMDKNPGVGVLGTNAKLFGEQNQIFYLSKLPLTDSDIKAYLIFDNPIFHPTTMMRTNIFKKYGLVYKNIAPTEDYELWYRMRNSIQFANLNEILFCYRLPRQSYFASHQKAKIIFEHFRMLLQDLKMADDDYTVHLHYHPFAQGVFYPTQKRIKQYQEHLKTINRNNKKLNIYPVEALERYSADYWNKCFYYICDASPFQVFYYWYLGRKIRMDEIYYFFIRLARYLFPKKYHISSD